MAVSWSRSIKYECCQRNQFASYYRGGLEMDLREYIEGIKSVGALREVEGADWNLEIGAITEMVGEKDGPALLFDNIKGYPKGYRVLSNYLKNSKHVNKAFGFPAEQPTL